MTIRFLLLLFLSSFLYQAGYGGDRYKIADTYLKNGEYEMAAEAYHKILEENGPAALSKDVRATIGELIALYKIQNYKQSFALCKRALKLEKYNSTAIFYAGLNLEAMGNDKLAVKLYEYYERVKPDDPYRYFIKARYDLLKEKEIVERVNNAIQMEGRLTTQKLPDNAIAILYAVNESVDASWDVVGKGLAQLIIDDLTHVKAVNVISRVELQLLLEKLKFSVTDLINENLIPRFGRLLQAKHIASGRFSIDANNQLSITLGMIDISQPDVVETTEFSGRLKDIFKLQKNITVHILDRMGIALTSRELAIIQRYQTTNLDAFLAYCHGLDLLDYGNPDGAYSNFSVAVKYDSRFQLAVDMKEKIDAMITMETEDMAGKHFELISRRRRRSVIASGSVSMSRARLQNVMYNLNLGFLPGTESRKGPTGFDPIDVLTHKSLLPEPPSPPANN